ncbi:hypothetical protein M231_07816, partial [Tremella mesenterica]
MLNKLDPPVAISMGHNHCRVRDYLESLKNKLIPASFRKTAESLETTHSTAAALRLGGMGMMLAVSWGEGTDWHVDSKDYGNHYTIISVLGSPALLHLPELGCTIRVKPGDVVGFLAHRYLHKLEPLRDDCGDGGSNDAGQEMDESEMDGLEMDGVEMDGLGVDGLDMQVENWDGVDSGGDSSE